MINTSESQSINLCFVGLPLADQATIERVVSFCKARGQDIETSLNPSQSQVLITDDDENNLKTARQLQNNNLLLVISNDDCTEGDVQLKRPLLVTRVMRTMESLSEKLATLDGSDNSEAAAVKTPINDATSEEASSKAASVTKNTVLETPCVPEAAPIKLSENDYLALVIDDSSAIRKQLEIELRTAGLNCEFAEDGEQALEKIQATTYDLVFLDIMMPGIDGYETCGKIRKDPRYKKTPVVMLSGKTAPLDEVKGVLAGASTYLTKPVQHEQFQRVTGRITRWLDEFR
jgi:CheY-like chemotaxis protein